MSVFRESVDKNQKSSEGYTDDIYIVVNIIKIIKGILTIFILLLILIKVY
jgi:hypothetical protein